MITGTFSVMFCVLDNRFTLLELKTYVDGFVFSAIAHLMKAPITVGSENVPNSQSSAYRRKYNHLFKSSYSKNTHY